MSVESRAFLHLLRTEFNSRVAILGTIPGWNSDVAWSALMLGTAQTRAGGDHGVLGRMGRTLGYEIQAEYLRVDQIWYATAKEGPDDWVIEAFIEHENNAIRAPETVRKLLQLGPGLKVLVTYPTNEDEAIMQVATLVKTRHGTPADVQLVLVFGFLDGSSVKWNGYEIDGMGRTQLIP